MRNRLVSGIRDDKICNRLLSEGTRLTWAKAVKVSIAADVKNYYAVKGSRADSNTNTIAIAVRVLSNFMYATTGTKTKQKLKCHRCLSTYHNSAVLKNLAVTIAA